MKYLVTGGAGFIGSNLVKELVKENDVIVVDNLISGDLNNLADVLDKITFIRASAGDVLEIDKFKGIDGIFHLGVTASSIFYRDNPLLTGNAMDDFIKLLELSKRENCRIVYASTSSIYSGNGVPYNETQDIKVADFYSEVRYFFERMSQLYYNLYGTKSVGLRFFSVYGPGEESKKDRANLVSQFLWLMQKDESPVVWGDGTQDRDFIYVGDVVDAMIMSMNANVSIECDVFNVGTGRSYTLNELVATLNKLLNKNILTKFIKNPLEGRAYFAQNHLADTEKARDVLGFIAKTSLEEGIKQIL
jgi:UDP-glucose 4-epimerase